MYWLFSFESDEREWKREREEKQAIILEKCICIWWQTRFTRCSPLFSAQSSIDWSSFIRCPEKTLHCFEQLPQQQFVHVLANWMSTIEKFSIVENAISLQNVKFINDRMISMPSEQNSRWMEINRHWKQASFSKDSI